VYIRGCYQPVYNGGCYQPVYNGGYPACVQWWVSSLCTMVGMQPMYHGGYAAYVPWWVGSTLGSMVGIHPWASWWVYTSLLYVPVYHPGYTHHAHHPVHVCASSPAHAEVPGVRALGSRKRIPLGGRLLSVLKSLRCEGRAGHSAQSYSALPVESVTTIG